MKDKSTPCVRNAATGRAELAAARASSVEDTGSLENYSIYQHRQRLTKKITYRKIRIRTEVQTKILQRTKGAQAGPKRRIIDKYRHGFMLPLSHSHFQTISKTKRGQAETKFREMDVASNLKEEKTIISKVGKHSHLNNKGLTFCSIYLFLVYGSQNILIIFVPWTDFRHILRSFNSLLPPPIVHRTSLSVPHPLTLPTNRLHAKWLEVEPPRHKLCFINI